MLRLHLLDNSSVVSFRNRSYGAEPYGRGGPGGSITPPPRWVRSRRLPAPALVSSLTEPRSVTTGLLHAFAFTFARIFPFACTVHASPRQLLALRMRDVKSYMRITVSRNCRRQTCRFGGIRHYSTRLVSTVCARQALHRVHPSSYVMCEDEWTICSYCLLTICSYCVYFRHWSCANGLSAIKYAWLACDAGEAWCCGPDLATTRCVVSSVGIDASQR